MNHSYDCLFFDLDGTLLATEEGITHAIRHTLNYYGQEADPAILKNFIGPPLTDSFVQYCGFTREEAEAAVVNIWRPFYAGVGIYEYDIYEGIPAALQALKDAGKRLYVATSKPEDTAKHILAHADLDLYFDGIFGATHDESRSHKDAVLAYAIRCSGIEDPGRALMIGDTRFDILGGRKNGIRTMGVLYGYGPEADLIAAGADHLVRDARELVNTILG